MFVVLIDLQHGSFVLFMTWLMSAAVWVLFEDQLAFVITDVTYNDKA
jgi:hypothetical protein